MPLVATVANRVHLPLDGDGPLDAHGLAVTFARDRLPNTGSPALSERVAHTLADLVELAARDRSELARLKIESAIDLPLFVVPRFDRDVHDLAGLAAVSDALSLRSSKIRRISRILHRRTFPGILGPGGVCRCEKPRCWCWSCSH